MKNVMSLFLFLASVALSFGQTIPKGLSDIVNQSSYIFEGRVIRSDSYWGQENRTIYTSHTVEIKKIFKGDLECGTIEVITEGGRVGDTELLISHNINFNIGDKGIFACVLSNVDSSVVDFYPETNELKLGVIYSEQGFFREYEDLINKDISNLFYSFDSLTQAYQAIELVTQLNYIDCEVVSLGNNIDNPVIKYPNPKKKSSKTYAENLILSKKSTSSKSNITQTTSLTYAFENLQITGVSPRYLEFDIYLSADDNNSYFDNGAVAISYDTTVFGSNIYTNGRVEVTRGTVLASVINYQEPDSLTWDNTGDIFNIVFFARNNPASRFNLTTTPTQAVHIKIEFKNCSIPSTILFTNHTFMLNNSLYTTTPNAPTSSYIQYPSIDDDDYENLPVCFPIITDFNPKTAHGGVGDIVTISGNYFTNSKGNIALKNADNGGQSLVILDKIQDIISWNDTEIKFIVPSVKDTITSTNVEFPVGTGPIILGINNDTLSTSTYSLPNLAIDYSLRNTILPGTSSAKKRIDLVDAMGSILGNGGYVFNTNPTLEQNILAISAVKKAVNEWVCLTNVHFEVGSSIPLWNKDVAMEDSINMIQFGKTNSVTTLAETRTWLSYCPSVKNPFIKEIDLVLKDTSFWAYDTTGTQNIPLGKYDFYGTVLHELGHAHLLNHTNQIYDIMYYNSPPGQLASQRVISLSLPNQNAGNSVINHSAVTPHGSCMQLNTMILISGNNCNPINTIITEVDLAVKIYPNPVNNILNIENPGNEKLTVEIFNDMGLSLYKGSLMQESNLEIDVTSFSYGIYVIVFSNSRYIKPYKLIKQ